MTFEEFFIKKRIDLALLQRAKPDLYEEFRQHYAQMGEKSFDHTKKYWFNQLRKTFLLPMPETPVPKPKPTGAPAAAASNEPVASVSEAAKPTGSSMGPSGFKPRFKATAIKATPDSKTPSEKSPEETPPTTKPLGFKPRFKAGVTNTPQPATGAKPHDKPSGTDNETANQRPEDKHAAPEKPLGFKPRFKPGITGANKGKSG